MLTLISFSISPVAACATVEIVSTLNRVVMVCADRSSQMRRCSGSMASDFSVRMPCTVSTSSPCRLPSAS